MRAHRLIAAVLIAGCFAGAGGTAGSADDEPVQAMNRLLADARAVEHRVRGRLETTENLRRDLLQQAADLKSEISPERLRGGAAPLPQAPGRIDYNLRLIQRLSGYLELLKDRSGQLHAVIHTLESYCRQIQDDLLLLRTLEPEDAPDRVRRMAADLDRLRSDADRPVLSASIPRPPPLDVVRNEILPGK